MGHVRWAREVIGPKVGTRESTNKIVLLAQPWHLILQAERYAVGQKRSRTRVNLGEATNLLRVFEAAPQLL